MVWWCEVCGHHFKSDVPACPTCESLGLLGLDPSEHERMILQRWMVDGALIPAPGSPGAVGINSWRGPEAHRRIANALVALKANGKPNDFLSVSDYLRRRQELIGAGGIDYIAGIVALVTDLDDE